MTQMSREQYNDEWHSIRIKKEVYQKLQVMRRVHGRTLSGQAARCIDEAYAAFQQELTEGILLPRIQVTLDADAISSQHDSKR